VINSLIKRRDMNLDQPLVAAAAQISPVFMKKKESIEKYAECLRLSASEW